MAPPPESPSDEVYVAVDVGTSGARAVAVTMAGRVVANARRRYAVSRPRPGWVEQDARDWLRASQEALTDLCSRVRGRIAAIGLTGQCPTFVAVGPRRQPLAPAVLYLDNRATSEADELVARLGSAAMHARTGHVPTAFFAAPKIMWMRRHQPEVFARTRSFLQPRDLVLGWLTGETMTDETQAGATLLFDLRSRRWSEEVLAATGVGAGQLPTVVPAWTVVGTVRPHVRTALGIESHTPVVVGGADSLCAAYGAGVFEPGPVSEMSGSSSCFNSAAPRPVPAESVDNYVHVVPGGYLTELGLNVAGGAIAWAVRSLGFQSFEALAAAAGAFRARARRGRSIRHAVEAVPIFLPYLGDGERDDPTIRGALLGLSGRHDRDAIAYSVLEGIALAAHRVLRNLVDSGLPFDELRVSGGGARLQITGQIKADVLGVPVVHLAGDTTATGTALLAAEATGEAARARGTIGRLVARGRVEVPDGPLAEFEAARSARFRALCGEPAVRSGPGTR